MLEFHNAAIQQLAGKAKLTINFPPQKYINSHSAEFLEERKTQLVT
jgi:hypothetical protein